MISLFNGHIIGFALGKDSPKILLILSLRGSRLLMPISLIRLVIGNGFQG
jgi:hypothetical protein